MLRKSQKIESVHFYSYPKQNPPPSLSPRQKEIAHSSGTTFSEDIFPEQKGGGEWGENYGVEKNTKINEGIGHKF